MDSLYWGDIHVNQVLAAVSSAVAVVFLIFFATRKGERKPLFAERVALQSAQQAEEQMAVQPTEQPVEEIAEEQLVEEVAEEQPVEEAAEEHPQTEE